MGPATPLVPTTKIFLPCLRNLVWFFWFVMEKGVWFISWLGMEMIL